MDWRAFADWAKHRPWALRAAGQLGRGHGRLRPLDRLAPPPPRAPVKPDLRGWAGRRLSAVWVGHATVLLRIGGMTILTDPVFSDRVGLGMGLLTVGPRRLVAPALKPGDLPPIDLVLVSHAHFDHLDRPSLLKLANRSRRTPVLTSLHNADLIREIGLRRARELAPGATVRVGGVRVTSVAVPHWGPRVFVDGHRGYCGFVVEAIDVAGRVLFGGDSAFGAQFDALADARRPIDLAILGIGGYDPYVAAHATPEQAWEMFRRCGARRLLPMHHSTYRLSYEPIGAPIARLLAAAGDEAGRVVVRRVGESWTARDDPTGIEPPLTPAAPPRG